MAHLDCSCIIAECKNSRCGIRDLKVLMDRLSGYCVGCFIKSFLCEVCGLKRCECLCMIKCILCKNAPYNICLHCKSRCKQHYLTKQCDRCKQGMFCPRCGEIKSKNFTKHASSQKHKNAVVSGKSRAVVPKTKKMEIWNRFNSTDLKGRCWCCRSDLYFIDAEMGHITPHAEGGGYESDNLVPICSSCNKACSDRNLIEYRELVYPDQIFKELEESKIDDLTARLIQDNHGGTEYNIMDICEIYRLKNDSRTITTIKYIIGSYGKIRI